MHKAPDYSAAYVVLRTDADDRLEGHGLTFTAGRGTEVCVAAINALAPFIVGKTLESITSDMRQARGGDASRRVPCLHDLGRVARLLGREASKAMSRSGRAGLDPREDE